MVDVEGHGLLSITSLVYCHVGKTTMYYCYVVGYGIHFRLC